MDINKSTILSNSNDARVVVNFTEDDIKVYADFIPESKDGSPLSDQYINMLLEKMSIQSGHLFDNIKDAVERCNATKRPIKDVLIAKGEAPVDESPAYYELASTLRAPAKPGLSEGAKADYRAWSPFIVVKTNQILAVRHEAVAGVCGKTVHGKEVPYRTMQKKTVEAGKNTTATETNIISNVDGLFLLSGNVLNVETLLVIRGAVGYETGNINFPGDVEMQGAVNDGFKLLVGGTLTAKETLDATDVIVQGNLFVKGGMIGRGRSLVKVSGAIEARFIQGCRVACKKSISVTNDVVNSTLYTMESLVAGDKGIIMGGEVFAFNSVCAGRIGKENSAQTKIHIGNDWTITQDIENNENTLRVIEAKLEKVQVFLDMPNLSEDKLAKVRDMKIRLENELAKCVKKQEDLNKRHIADNEAYLECSGIIAPGTLIEICGIEFIVSRALTRTRLVLDKETGRVLPLPLTKK
ncbi:MAG: FapA family protein [Spirochaetaceae bacterium]|nr:FapA family protein [Spirochaetaceae bacterium]